jgi:hypothetical protein
LLDIDRIWRERGSPLVRTSVAWFNRSDWDELQRLCDSDDLQGTFDEWLARAEAGIAGFNAQGFLVEKVIVTPDDIRAFERTTGAKIDHRGRMQIAGAKMAEPDWAIQGIE